MEEGGTWLFLSPYDLEIPKGTKPGVFQDSKGSNFEVSILKSKHPAILAALTDVKQHKFNSHEFLVWGQTDLPNSASEGLRAGLHL